MVIKKFLCHLILCAKCIYLYKLIGHAFTVRCYNVLPNMNEQYMYYNITLLIFVNVI